MYTCVWPQVWAFCFFKSTRAILLAVYDLWLQRVAFQLFTKERRIIVRFLSCVWYFQSVVLASLCLVVECLNKLNSSLFILLGDFVGPKIQARRHFCTNQIRIIIHLFSNPNIFLLISFWSEFSDMFLFCVFSRLVKKYKSVTSMLMRFWSEISRIFSSVFLGLIVFRLKRYVFSADLPENKKSCGTWGCS